MFDSFVAEGLLVAGMPGVFHWAAFYGSALSLNHLWRDGTNLEEKDDVMRHTAMFYFLFSNESFRRGIHQSCGAQAWKICNGLCSAMQNTE